MGNSDALPHLSLSRSRMSTTAARAEPSQPVLSRLRGRLMLLAGLGLLTSPAAAAAQAWIPQVSPGPLSKAHQRWDEPGPGCIRCHQLAGPITGESCLECHTHAPMKEAGGTGHGLHATFTERCAVCHAEHKGRQTPAVDWGKVGGKDKFDHKRTGFNLAGMHANVKCASCHKRKTAAATPLFAGLKQDCAACHVKRHAIKESLRDKCLGCHVVGGAGTKAMRLIDVPLDHGAASGMVLSGKHIQVRCVQCHEKMAARPAIRACSDCHKNKHGATFAGRACGACHQQDRAWGAVLFDHGKTKFALEGVHSGLACVKCHKNPNVKPSTECSSCHGQPHGSRWGKLQCRQCHAGGGLRTMVFEHGKLTKFVLLGKHAQINCRKCHRGSAPTEFERLQLGNCGDCHFHQNAHRHQFDDKKCTQCHAESGSKKMVFSHDRDSKFPLVGLHAAAAQASRCNVCHPGGLYRSGKLTCAACHEDPHKKQFGTACERCHSPEIAFKKARASFDHDKRTQFPLEGLHQKVSCEKCHPAGAYKTGRTRCADCHKEEPHQGKLGTECARCHRVEKGAPKFAHETMTKFVRTGRHLEVACGFCHRPPPETPPVPGWTRTLPPPALDRKFPVMGKKCAECHADRHGGTNGPNCERCHDTSSFKNVSAAIHDTGIARLEGQHKTLACGRCHDQKRLLSGTQESCGMCHRDDDPHRNALGEFCGDCHQQTDWRPARFSHGQTGFPLRGAHRSARCDQCHGAGVYQGLPTECEVCHQGNAARVSDPIHTAELRPCERCHSEVGFVPARASHPNFPLNGRHLLNRCRDCHGRGIYAGTPDTCVSCHLARYNDPATQPDHRVAGYGLTCEDCHTPIGWKPAHK